MQWATGTSVLGDTNFSHAIAAAGGLSSNDIIVASLGGDDFIGGGCNKSLNTLSGEIRTSYQALQSAIAATGCASDCPRIITFGYVTPSTSPQQNCPTVASYAPLNQAIAAATNATGITYVDTTAVCGGSTTAFSPASPCFGMCYMGTGGSTGVACSPDTVHLNQRAYCMLITPTATQSQLGCTASAGYTCSGVDEDLDRVNRDAARCTAFPCPSPPPPSVIIEQTIQFTEIVLGDWTLVKPTFNVAYGIALGIYNASGSGWAEGCGVHSGAVTGRRSIAAVFTATVSSTLGATAQAQANGMTTADFIAAVNSAKAALGTSVSVPTPTSVVVNAPGAYQRIPPPPPPSDPASDSAGLIIAVVGIVGMICCVLMVGRCMRESISDAKAEMERNRANALPCVAQEATPKNSPALFPVTPPGQHLPAMELQGDGGPSQLSGMVPSGAPN